MAEFVGLKVFSSLLRSLLSVSIAARKEGKVVIKDRVRQNNRHTRLKHYEVLFVIVTKIATLIDVL